MKEDTNDVEPYWLELPAVEHALGVLCYAQEELPLPFAVERVYYVNGVPAGARRGGHAHKRTRELVIALRGAVTLSVYNAQGREVRFRLDDARRGVYVPPCWWVELADYVDGTTTLVLASKKYEESDYIREPGKFFQCRPWPRGIS